MEEQTEIMLRSAAPLLPSADLAELGSIANQVAHHQLLTRYRATLAPETQRRHRYDLRHFQAYLQAAAAAGGHSLDADLSEDLSAWRGMTAGLLSGFKEQMRQEGHSIGTINLRLATVKRYCGLAAAAGHLDKGEYGLIMSLVKPYKRGEGLNVDSNRRAVGLPTRHPRAKKAHWTEVTTEQVKQLLALCDELATSSHPSAQRRAARDRLLILLTFQQSLRVGEIAPLTLASVNLAEGLLTFDRPKVKLYQVKLALLPETRKALTTWLMLRHLENTDVSAPLIPAEHEDAGQGKQGEPQGTRRALSVSAISHRLQVLGRKLGLTNLSYHDGRHYWATDAARRGTSAKVLQDAGGWRSPVIPLGYIASAAIANEGIQSTPLE